jgi:hypothetical protein
MTAGIVTGVVLIVALILVITTFSPASGNPGQALHGSPPASASGRASTAGRAASALSATQDGVLTDPGGFQAQGIAFSPDGKTIAASFQRAASYGDQGDPNAGRLDLWNVATRQLTGPLRDFDGGYAIWVGDVAFDPANPDALAIADWNRVDLWNLTTNAIGRPSNPEYYQISEYVAYAPDGETIAEDDSTGVIHLLNGATGQFLAQTFRDPVVYNDAKANDWFGTQ